MNEHSRARAAMSLAGLWATILSVTSAVSAAESGQPVVVNVDNFVRAETAAQFDRILQLAGGINRFGHLREPTPLDKQSVICMNRDTLYSAAIVDISKGATLTVPDAGNRYLSVMVVNEDHCLNEVIHAPDKHELTMEKFGTPYGDLSVRILVNASDPDDIRKANARQDQLKIEAVSARPYTHPKYDRQVTRPPTTH
jgi:hypothetical protein